MLVSVRSAFTIAAIVMAVCATGCPDNPADACSELACPMGQICDPETGTCVPSRLDRFDGVLPGRALSIAAHDSTLYLASFEPESRSILAGSLGRQSRDIRVLHESSRSVDALEIVASGVHVAVVWQGEDRQLRMAWRSTNDSNAFWTIQQIQANLPYQSREKFAAVMTSDGVAIAFRTPSGTLAILEPESIEGPHRLVEVDTGGASTNGVVCPEAVRMRGGAGVGREPSIALDTQGDFIVAYQDEDCGDLRVARNLDDAWRVEVVDTGEAQIDASDLAQRSFVGRFSSVALSPAGGISIAYYDESRHQLKFARTTDRGWSIEVVDPGLTLDQRSRERKAIVGTFARLSYDDLGATLITYQDATELSVKLARRAPGASRWEMQTLLSDGIVGFEVSHAHAESEGFVVAAERLEPSEEGTVSRLEVHWE